MQVNHKRHFGPSRENEKLLYRYINRILMRKGTNRSTVVISVGEARCRQQPSLPLLPTPTEEK
jgi:hypothetical protein